MKTKTLIEYLQKEDPEGSSEVLIGNMDILPIIYREAGYWDGRMRLAEYNEGNKHPDRIRVTSSGIKINLIPIDSQEQYVDKILYHQKEFDYDVEGGSKTYPFNHEHMTALNSKMGWTFVAESYTSWFFNYESRKDKKEATLSLINDLKIKYATESKNSLLHTVNERLTGKTKDSAIEVIEKIYSYCPIAIVGSLTFGSDYVTIQAESNWTYKFGITLPTLGFGGGKIMFLTQDQKSDKKDKYGNVELEYNDESYKLFGESILKSYQRYLND